MIVKSARAHIALLQHLLYLHALITVLITGSDLFFNGVIVGRVAAGRVRLNCLVEGFLDF